MEFETKRTSKVSLWVRRGVTSLSALARSRLPGSSIAHRRETSRPARRKLVYAYVTVGILAGLGVAWGAQSSKKEEEEGQLAKLEPRVLHGAPGLKKASDGYVRWREYATKVYIDGSVERLHPGATEAVQAAFGEWLGSDAILPELEIDSSAGNRLGARRDGKNSVVVAPIDIRGHEDDLAVTVSYWNDTTGDIGEADIIINAKVAFDVIPVKEDGEPDCDGGRYDLQNVLTHEVGHFFGLGEDAEDREATMYLSSRMCETRKREIEGSDETALVGLYVGGLGPSEEPGLLCSFRGAPSGGSGSGSAALLAGLALLRLVGKRRRG